MKRDFLICFRGSKTQSEVVIASELSRSMYTQIETGDRTPSVATAKRIAEVLEFDWILFFKDKSHDTCIMEVEENENNPHGFEKCDRYPERSEKGSKETTTSNSV